MRLEGNYISPPRNREKLSKLSDFDSNSRKSSKEEIFSVILDGRKEEREKDMGEEMGRKGEMRKRGKEKE